MAHTKFRADPAMEKFQAMRVNRHKYFRFNARTARLSFIYLAVIPGLLGWAAYSTENRWQIRAKRKGDSLLDQV